MRSFHLFGMPRPDNFWALVARELIDTLTQE